MNATYRLQLTPEFTFKDVQDLLPYFAKLGVSHLYLSPITQSRVGSTHGYDVIDHNLIRQAFGGPEGLMQLFDAAEAHALKFVVDFVPNHAGVGSHNAYWQDVLRFGPHAKHADFFDINWTPLKAALKDKVLLPFLGNPYGDVLDNGELGLQFEDGYFYCTYYEERFALNPATYGVILEALLAAYERTEAYFDLKDIFDAYEELEPQQYDKAEALRVRLLALEGVDFSTLPKLETAVMHALLEKQFWRLAHWQTAGFDINYRRFFDINDLVALHMENPKVFWDSHRMLADLATHAQFSGIRVDHIDGLFDPEGYLQNVQDLGIKKVWVEKILASGEVLPETWQCDGTSGYEFMNDVLGVLVNPEGEASLLRSYRDFMGDYRPLEDEIHDAKMLVMETSLSGELLRLAVELEHLAEANYHTRDFTLQSLQDALAEIITAFPRYRTYLPYGKDEATAIIQEAVTMAKWRNPATERSVYDFIVHCLLETSEDEGLEPQRQRFVGRFQQYTAPLMAKGMEDTTFYRYLPFAARNEVGGEPEAFATASHAFHARARFRAFRYPDNLLATATHDHKRGEDTRMRLATLSEIPEAWEEMVQALHTRGETLQRSTSVSTPFITQEPSSAHYLLYQLLPALWEGDATDTALLQQRLTDYMVKAMREAKLRTSWLNPDNEYETGVTELICQLIEDDEARAIFTPIAAEMARLGFHNTLAQMILKLTTPGVPDFYQGTEFLDLSLVDPDNRREVDYAARNQLLDEMAAYYDNPDAARMRAWMDAQDPQAKIYLISYLLRQRRRYPELFAGDYQDLAPEGEGAEHLLAFARSSSHNEQALLAFVTRFPKTLGAQDLSQISVSVPEALEGKSWYDLLSGKRFVQDSFTLADFPLPFALLISEA